MRRVVAKIGLAQALALASLCAAAGLGGAAPGSEVALPAPATATTLAALVARPDGARPWRCAHCHTDVDWRAIPDTVEFDHATTGVPLSGRHASAPCSGCHSGHLGKRGVARTCRTCHPDPHRGEQGRRCEDCHTSGSWRDARAPINHARSRFPLTGAHGATACRSCHRQRRRFTWRGTPSTCDACHRSISLPVKAFDHRLTGRGCQACHTTFAWAPARMDHAIFWPLEGAHAAIADACARCHGDSAFTSADKACASCHLSLVTAGKTHPDHLASGFPLRCEGCHTAVSWNAMRPGWHEPFFPLAAGDHARYRDACQTCHPTGMGKGRFDCIHCHEGEHDKAKMDGEHDDVGGYSWTNPGCLDCHPKGES